MNRFMKYISKLDEITDKATRRAKDYDAIYNKIKLHYDAIRADRVGDPSRGAIDPDHYVDCLQTKANLAAAETGRDKYWATLTEDTAAKIAEIRAEFAAALDDAYSADPAALDAATLTLLESGICDAHEYGRLLVGAMKKDNPTLARVIGSYAAKRGDEVERDLASGGETKAAEYRAIATEAAEYGKIADKYLAVFDGYADAITTATGNKAMLYDEESMAGFSATAIQGFNSLG